MLIAANCDVADKRKSRGKIHPSLETRSEAETAIKSIDLDDIQKLVGEDSEQAVYHLNAAGSQIHCG